MPSNSPKDGKNNAIEDGVLYIVATPIGNLEDITLRAIKVLSGVDVVAAEDTRHTGQLLTALNLKNKLISYHEHNERERSGLLIDKLISGESIALVSDAGTPSVSDPGYRLVKKAVRNGVKVVPIPGVSAAITALSVSGLPTDTFVFAGFMNRKKSKRKVQLEALSKEVRTLIFYESPKRVAKFIDELILVFGERNAVLSREMTKYHEEFLRGTLSEISENLDKRDVVKGECTLVVEGFQQGEVINKDDIINEIADEIKGSDLKPSALAKEIAVKYGLVRKDVYAEIMRIKDK